MNNGSLTLVNASAWPSLTEGEATLFSASIKPSTIVPMNCNSPSAFAWLLFDERRQEVTAARDYLGLEPFYYYYKNQTLVFGSTIPEIIHQLPKRPELNINRLLEECFHDDQVIMTRYSNETHYQDIFRVEPGCRLHVKQGRLYQEKYWSFDSGGATLNYANEQDYLDHFGELLNRVVLSQTRTDDQLAAEFSGGLDSTAVLTSCYQNQIDLPLFCHIADGGEGGGDFSFAECVIKHFDWTAVHYVGAKQVELIPLFQKLAQIYAGVPPYIYPIMSFNVYQCIQQQGCNRILSGFGGDQCLSSHAGGRVFFYELLKTRGYRAAWSEYQVAYSHHHKLRATLNLLRFRSPALYKVLSKLGNMKQMLRAYLETQTPTFKSRLPQHYSSIREMQLDLLEGAFCHEIRARVEYSAVLGKTMGFTHVYPLLHPDIVDFGLRMPCDMKYHHGQSRYFIRKYLAQFVPEKNYTQKKRDGAHIMPAMMQKCKSYVASGQIDAYLQQLPFAKQLKPASSAHSQLRHTIFAYMIDSYLK